MDRELWRRTKKERGLTYQEISDVSGVPLGTVKNIFAGYTPDPRDSTIRAIERALGVETRIERRSEFSPPLTAKERNAFETYRKLPEDLRRRADAYLKKLAEVAAEGERVESVLKKTEKEK